MLKNLQLHLTKILLTTSFMLMGVISWGQSTVPSAHDLSTNYTLSSHSGSSYPASMAIGREGNDSDGSFNTDLDSNSSSGSSGGNWRAESSNGISYFANGSNQRGSFLLRLNSTSRTNVNVVWKVRDISTGSNTNNIELQWRIGSSGNWNDVTNDLYIQGTTSSGTGFNVTLPSGADNQSDLRVRWIYYETGSGGRDRLAIDDIIVSSTEMFMGPLVTTEAVSDVDTDLAILNGSITNGDATAVSFEYGTTTSYGTTEVGDPATITGDGDFAAIVALDVNTQYHYRAIITGGSEVGDDVAFWTLAAQPNAPVASNVDITTVDIAIGTDTNPATTQYAIYEFNTDTYVQSDGTLGATEAWHTATEWNAITVNGLTDNTEYIFYTKARNGANVETTESLDNATITTLEDTSPDITADPLTAFGNVCINTTTTENSFGLYGVNLTTDDVVVTAPTGYTLSTTASGTYTATLTYTADGAGELLEEVFVRFTPTVVQSYNDNITITGGGLATSVTVSVSGSGINTAATVSTSAASDVTINSATLGGNVTAEGCNIVTARGVVIGTSANPTIGGGGVTDYAAASGGSGTYTVSATGLSSNTQYYARSYATSTSGTAYGSDVTFTTLCGEFALPFSEDFEDVTFPPTCWTTFIGTNGLGTGENWQRATSATYNSSAGAAYVRWEDVGQLVEDWLVTPAIVLPDVEGTIELKYQESQANAADYSTQFYIKIATSNPSSPDSYTTVLNYDEGSFSDSYSERTVDLTAYEGQTVYVAFVMIQDDGDSWYIDDISITEVAPPLSAPVATTATNITTSGFTATWNAVDDATSYRLDVSEYEEFRVSSGTSTTTETFENIPASIGSYGTRNWTGVDGIDWTASPARTDQTLTSRAITLEDTNSAYLESGEIENGISSLSFDVKRAFGSGSDSGVLTVKILTGADYSTSTTLGTITFGSSNNNTVAYSSGAIADVTGDFKIRIENDGSERPIIDNLVFTTNGFSASYVAGYEDLNVGNVTNYDVTGLDASTDYYYRVRAVSASETSGDSNIIEATTGAENVWNGTEWTAGSAPATIDAAIIEGAYNTADDGVFSAATLTINTGGSIVIASGDNLTITGAVVNNEDASAFIIENNANLIQVDDVANTGDIQVQKDSSPLYRLDYTIWSAPVTGQNLLAFSPQTLTNRFYDYDESTDLYTLIAPDSNDFQPGYGYLIRTPNNHVSFVEESTPGESWTGTFEGEPNNGTITVSMETAFNGYNLVGNPYPSPINVAEFYTDNASTLELGSALYFWRKRNNPDATTYCTLTNAAYTANSAAGGDTGSWFNGVSSSNWVINPGQGFFVKATGGSLVFNNAMRAEMNNGQFFRTTEDAQQESSRLWLNLTAEGKFSQMAIVYNANMTLGIDYGWDGKALVADGPVTLYTIAQEENLAIQARPEFNEADQVPVGFYAATPGNYTITLDHVDGLFAEGQEIYINDNLLNITHNLTEGSYSFSSVAGTFNDRFEVIYTIQGVLDTNNPILTSNEVITYKDGNSIMIDAGTAEIDFVNVYDINGRLLYKANGVNATTTVVNSLRIEQQVIILEINTNKGTVNKKFVF